jgi:hypothetical protein
MIQALRQIVVGAGNCSHDKLGVITLYDGYVTRYSYTQQKAIIRNWVM